MYYNRARYLDVNRGRFWSQDSFEGNNHQALSLHKYLYAHGDPVNGIDPSGHVLIKQLAAIGIGLVLGGLSTLFLTDRVKAPTGDFIKDEVSRTQADYDDARNLTINLSLIVAVPVLLSALSRVGTVVSRLRPAGAGQYFEDAELLKPNAMVKQSDPNNMCGPACGEQLLREEGIEISQAQLTQALEKDGLKYHHLVNNLNKVSSGWRGGVLPREAFFQLINRNRPFIAKLKGFNKDAHYVIVDAILKDPKNGSITKVIYRDPGDGYQKLQLIDKFLDEFEGAVFK